MLVSTCKVVEDFELSVVVKRHHAMSLVKHVLLSAFCRPKLLVAIQTEFAKLNAFGNIGKQTFEVYETLNVHNEEGVLHSHMV